MHLLWPIFFHTLISTSLAILVNVTVDDTFGDPKTGRNFSYISNDQWHAGSHSNLCTACHEGASLNETMLMNGSWHYSITESLETSPPLAHFQFFGSAIYVYCILADTLHLNGSTDMTFLIDAQPVGNFSREPSGNHTFHYNALVYANQDLPQGNHNLTIQNGNVGGPNSLVLLDYIVYTYDDFTAPSASTSLNNLSSPTQYTSPRSQSSSSDVRGTNTASKIVGGILGSIAIVLLALVVYLWHRQRNINGPMTGSQEQTPPSRFRGTSWMQGLQRSLNNGTSRRFSFNPNLLVQSRMQPPVHNSTSHFRHPPPVTMAVPIHPPPERPDSTRPLQPNRQATPTPSLDARNERSQPLSILEWQRRTQREADDVAPRFDVSDVDMSSYYDFSSDTPDLPQPQPRPPPRRFTVVNV